MSINWDILLHELDAGKCVLCIGPDVYSRADDDRLERRLADTLRSNSAALGIRVYEDGWFHYLKERDELATWFAVKQFYETQLPAETDDIFRAVAALPFHLILNFSPDYRLREAFRAAGKPFEFSCLYKNPELDKSRSREDALPDKAKPLIFNMLGEIEDKDSLVMTYDDLFGYMEAVFEKKRMPQNVKLKIQQATHFIFLGMPLDKWYFHLLMRVLNMHRDTAKTRRFAASYSVNGANATFSEEQYSLTFAQESIGAFIRELHAKWTAAQEQKSGATGMNAFDRWREMVKTGEDVAVRQAFREIKPFADKSGALGNEQILLEMQWNGFTSTAFETEMARNAMKSRVAEGILFLVDQIEQLNPDA
jgi:hypothetical protein